MEHEQPIPLFLAQGDSLTPLETVVAKGLELEMDGTESRDPQVEGAGSKALVVLVHELLHPAVVGDWALGHWV